MAKKKSDTQAATERAVVGALRSSIRDHGPITPEQIGSAAKRVVGNLKNASPSSAAAALGRRRWAGLDAMERAAIARAGGLKGGAAGGTAAWAGMTKEERSAEMKRRAAKRKANADQTKTRLR